MEAVYALIPAVLVLAVGIIAIVGMRQLGQSPIVGYMIGGMLIGPNALGLIADNHTTQLLAELGVVFLLFDIGLLFSLQHVWDARRDIFILGPIQILLCLLVFGESRWGWSCRLRLRSCWVVRWLSLRRRSSSPR